MILNIKQLSPKRKISSEYYIIVKVKTGIDEDLKENTFGFFLLYIFICAILSLLITITAKTNLTSAMFEIAYSLSAVGYWHY